MTQLQQPQATPLVLLVTGLSGAGKSTALKALEDAGYEAVDNLPLSLLEPLLKTDAARKLAIGVDVRSRAFSPADLLRLLEKQAGQGREIRMLFLEANGPELIRRYSETRRRHPLAPERPASDGIAMERDLLAELRRVADVVVDTSDLSTNDLRRTIKTKFGDPDTQKLTLTIRSFGYARGVPRDADLVFDMRFLRNPHWVPNLRALTGKEEPVRAYVESDPIYKPAVGQILELLKTLLPAYLREGRAYLTVAFGCTGGKHRSVAVAEYAGEYLLAEGWPNAIVHRDRERQTSQH